MNVDAELEVWRQQWQSETVVPLDLRTRVQRESRLMKIALIVDILVTIVIGGGVILAALRSQELDVVLLAVATWFFLAAAWMFTLTVSRGTWSPSALDTAAFVHLSVRRCRGRLAAIWFAACLYLVQMAFCLGWIFHHSAEHRSSLLAWLFFSWPAIDFVWLITLAFFVFLVWFRKKKQAELLYLLNLCGQLPEERPDITAEQDSRSLSLPHWIRRVNARRKHRSEGGRAI